MSYNLLERVTAFAFSMRKDRWLKEQRGIGFEEIIELIKADQLLDVVAHPNQERYPDQYLAVVDAQDYVIEIPFIADEGGEIWFLKTAFFSRKATRKYYGKGRSNEKDTPKVQKPVRRKI